MAPIGHLQSDRDMYSEEQEDEHRLAEINMAVRSWSIKGNDGKTYAVQERATPGIRFNGGTLPSGGVEYVLADGTDVTDDTPGHWETAAGVLLKKPDDL